jgi:hypothetical protein
VKEFQCIWVPGKPCRNICVVEGPCCSVLLLELRLELRDQMPLLRSDLGAVRCRSFGLVHLHLETVGPGLQRTDFLHQLLDHVRHSRANLLALAWRGLACGPHFFAAFRAVSAQTLPDGHLIGGVQCRDPFLQSNTTRSALAPAISPCYAVILSLLKGMSDASARWQSDLSS